LWGLGVATPEMTHTFGFRARFLRRLRGKMKTKELTASSIVVKKQFSYQLIIWIIRIIRNPQKWTRCLMFFPCFLNAHRNGSPRHRVIRGAWPSARSWPCGCEARSRPKVRRSRGWSTWCNTPRDT
jgi:hypothetical protein